jgi:DNA-binding NarL/FixJ family response regulator
MSLLQFRDLSASQKMEIVERVREGQSRALICGELNLTELTVRQVLREANAIRRP